MYLCSSLNTMTLPRLRTRGGSALYVFIEIFRRRGPFLHLGDPCPSSFVPGMRSHDNVTLILINHVSLVRRAPAPFRPIQLVVEALKRETPKSQENPINFPWRRNPNVNRTTTDL